MAQRSYSEWAARGFGAGLIALLSYPMLSHSAGYALKANPQLAHILTPDDGRITARLSETVFTTANSTGGRDRAAELARLALKQDPTAVRGAVTLGLDAQVHERFVGARRLFAYAQVLSRRELQTHLWAIEDAVVRNDIPGALRHYDTALRTSPQAPQLLFPVLTAAIDDASIRANLTKTLLKKPSWSAAFIDYLSQNAPDPVAASALLLQLKGKGFDVSDQASAATIAALTRKGLWNQAWSYYASIRPGNSRSTLRDPRFTSAVKSPSVFDWMPVNDSGISTSMQIIGRESYFDFSVSSAVSGLVLQQAQMLPPGRYRLSGRSARVSAPNGASPYWTLTCRDGRELGRVELQSATADPNLFHGWFDVPERCPLQTLSLFAKPTNTISGLSGRILEAELAADH